MYISKVIVNNFKCYEGDFELILNPQINILVGDNEAGKSSIIEAINLALSGLIYGKYIGTEITQPLFNVGVVSKYLQSLKTDTPLDPPEILIEVFFEIEGNEALKAQLEGSGNSRKSKASGVQFSICFNEKYRAEYNLLLNSGSSLESLPIEYYDFSWSSFARDDRLTPRLIPIKSHLIDSTSSRNQNGSDLYISRILRDSLSDTQKINVSQAHRSSNDNLSSHDSVICINKDLEQRHISDKNVTLAIDPSSKNSWESGFTTYFDGIPFNNIGKGEQCLVKTRLALSHKKTQEANILLLEEPENHLSHSKLNNLVRSIITNNQDKQIVISTHSSFVANKLDIGNVILLNKGDNGLRSETRINDLSSRTRDYFLKLSGYDTLRLVLCKKAILVEGPSDDLILQKAYLSMHGKLPIEDGIDIISVGTGFLNFLEISHKSGIETVVVTDSDGDLDALERKYANYIGEEKKAGILISYDDVIDSGNLTIGNNKPFNYNTLEPKLFKANNYNLDLFNAIFETKCDSVDSMHKYMRSNKTECALAIFSSSEEIKYPEFIINSLKWEHGI